MLEVSNKGLELLYLLSSTTSNLGIKLNTIYISFIKENTNITNPYGILIGYNCLYLIMENVKKG
jgi:hypothetical protein